MAQPIEVAVMRFRDPQDGHGISSSTVSDRRALAANQSGRHELEYHPWMHSFLVRYYETPNAKPMLRYVPREQVRFWVPRGEVPEPAQKRKG